MERREGRLNAGEGVEKRRGERREGK